MKEADPLLHCNPDALKPLRQLVNEEKKKVTDVWDNPKVPKMKLMKEMENLTWANQIKGAYQQSLKWRGEGKLAFIKEQMKKASEKRGQLTNYIQKIGTVLCYALIVMAAVCLCVPIAAYNYIRHEV